MKYTITQFRLEFPIDAACLEHLFNVRYGTMEQCPDCLGGAKFQPVKDRRAYQCPLCAYQVYPTAGTVFHKTTTPLTYWFYAIYLFTTTRNGVAAKELERQLDVCYKTALRMAHQIKKLMMDEEGGKLFGEVSIDETYFGQLGKNMHNSVKSGIKNGGGSKPGLMGFFEKDGRIVTRVLESGDKPWVEIVKDKVVPSATVITDSYPPYKNLKKSFAKHVRINHDENEYVKDGFTTKNIENYWSTLKRMIKGTHIHVSKRHLPKYVGENTFRYLHRDRPAQMFQLILLKL